MILLRRKKVDVSWVKWLKTTSKTIDWEVRQGPHHVGFCKQVKCLYFKCIGKLLEHFRQNLVWFCYQPVLLASLINGNWLQARQEIHWSFIACEAREARSRGGGVSWFLQWVEGNVMSRGWPKEWLAHPLNGTVSVGRVHLTFAPGSSEVVVGFFSSLCIFCPEFALTAACIQLFLVREGNGTPLQYSCLENPVDGGA